MEVPKQIQLTDNLTHITSIYEFKNRVNDRLYLYENTKTGCKQCFDIRELARMKKKKLKYKTKYERI